jgi:hypothetical protein
MPVAVAVAVAVVVPVAVPVPWRSISGLLIFMNMALFDKPFYR